MMLVEQYEDWTLKYMKDASDTDDFRKFIGVSATKIGRLLASYHALRNLPSGKKSPGSDGLKSKILKIFVANSKTTLFEINITFAETIKYFPNMERSFMEVVEHLDLPKSELIAYFSRVIVRKMDKTENPEAPGQINSSRLIEDAMMIVKDKFLYEDVAQMLNQFLAANKDNERDQQNAKALVKIYFPQHAGK